MASLREILEKLKEQGYDPNSDKAFEIASEILKGQQKERWERERERWGLEGKTPEEQRKLDEEKGPANLESKSPAPDSSGEKKG